MVSRTLILERRVVYTMTTMVFLTKLRELNFNLNELRKQKLEYQFSSVAQSCPTLFNPMDCSTPGFPDHHQLLELAQLMSIESVMPSNHLILCCPLLLLPSIFPCIRVFSSESVLHIKCETPKYWSWISLQSKRL